MESVLMSFVLSTLFVISSPSSRVLCPRIFFRNFNEEKMLYKIIEGVFIKENYYHNNFPVYRRENDNLLFYREFYDDGSNYLAFGRSLGDYFGVAAKLYGDPSSWLTSGILDRNDVFDGIIDKWQYYDKRDQTNYIASSASSPVIKAVCVDEDFRECNSGRVYLNVTFNDGKGNIWNNHTKDYFYRMPGLFRNLRPVYKHSAQSLYLQYVDGHWIETTSQSPSSSDYTLMRVKDFALRPEYITNIWSVHYNGWRDMPSLRVLCRGVTSMSNTCPSKPCDSKATCTYTSGNETLCICPSGYTGVRCSVNKQCPTPHPKAGTELSFDYLGKRAGDLGMSFCSESLPFIRYYVCVDDSYSSFWSGQGLACTGEYMHTTHEPTRTLATPQVKRIKFDDDHIVTQVFFPLAVFLQTGLPFAFYYCTRCKKLCEKVEEDEDDQRRETDQKEWNRRKRLILWRIYSIHLSFSFYFWLIYLVGCEMTHCTIYGSFFYKLRTFAMAMLVFSAVFVFIESFYSNDLVCLKNIIEDETAWQYIQRMQDVPPRINMVVECYHYALLPRIAYYYDRPYVESSLERIVTFVDQDEFAYGSWVDVSEREIPALGNDVVLICFEMDSSIVFGDQETLDDCERQVEEMEERNRNRDDHTESSWNEEIPGLKNRVSAFVDLRVKPFWIRPLFFWIATLLQMSWLYRWLFRAKTTEIHYTLKKEMYTSTTPPREADSMDPIAALVGSTSFSLTDNDQGNSSTGYPMLEMNNLGTGHSACENDGPSYPAFIQNIGRGEPAPTVTAPQNPNVGTLIHPHPREPQTRALLSSHAEGGSYPTPDSSTPHSGPSSSPSPAEPPPSVSPTSQSNNDGSSPVV